MDCRGRYHAPAALKLGAMAELARDRFGGIDRLYGAGALARLGACHVTVVGVGGVGSWAVEALARSGVGKLTLVDADDLCVSNTNRQLPALEGQYGRAKIEAMAERCRAINPGITLDLRPQFLTPANLGELLDAPGDAGGRPECANSVCSAAQTPPVQGLGQDQIPASDRHDDKNEGDGVRNAIAAGPQVRQAENILLHGFVVLHAIAPV